MNNQNDLMTACEPFIISCLLDAPRDRVWQAWTERKCLMQWFGPKGFTMPAAKMDLRPEGSFHFCLCSPNGEEMWGKWTFREIAPPGRIVLVNSFSDEDGVIIRHPLSPMCPLEMLSTTTIAEARGRTKLTIHWLPLQPTEAELKTFEEAHESMIQGWNGTFEQLADYLARI